MTSMTTTPAPSGKSARSLQLHRCLLGLCNPDACDLGIRHMEGKAISQGETAPLSRREEITLRRVALRYTALADLPRRDLVRLEALGLVTISNDDVVLTRIGNSGTILSRALRGLSVLKRDSSSNC